MEIKKIKKDLFKVDEKYALVHCISLDCGMGAGIAKEFNKRFKDMKSILGYFIRVNDVDCPNCILYRGDRYVYNLITKKAYYGKPTYNSLTEALYVMKENIIKNDIKYLAMPKIGCGLDRLSWGKVYNIIKDVFEDTDVNILICVKE